MPAQSILEVSLWLSLCVVCIVFSGLYSGAETGVYCVNRLRLNIAAHRKDWGAGLLQGLLLDRPALLSAILLGTNVANYLAPICLAVLFLQAGEQSASSLEVGNRAEIYTTLILTPVLFIFGEIVPKNIFQLHADRFMPRLGPLLSLTRWFFTLVGLVSLQRWISRLVLGRMSSPPAISSVLGSHVEMYELLHENAVEGNLTRMQVSMLERVHRLRKVSVSSVMIPNSMVQMLDSRQRRSQIEAFLRHSTHARMPVYEADRRHVVGVVHLLDIIDAPPATRVSEVMRPIVRISPQTTVLDALATLQRDRRRMAAIDDAGGACIGVVTVKDLVEEIVGELSAW